MPLGVFVLQLINPVRRRARNEGHVNDTIISWTNATWNPMHGCHKVSEGCRFCYAADLSLRYGHTRLPWTAANAAVNVTIKAHKLRDPYALKGSQRVFVNSMSDMFHELVPSEYIAQVFEVMNDLPQHVFQVLTKRPAAAAAWGGPWGANIWMGTSVESAAVEYRIDELRGCGARVKFLSIEPLVAPLGRFDFSGIDWVIVGGESGRHLKEPRWAHRWMDHAWAREVRDACVSQGVAFFFKQSSGARTEMGVALEEADGSFNVWQQFPGAFVDPVRVPRQMGYRELAAWRKGVSAAA